MERPRFTANMKKQVASESAFFVQVSCSVCFLCLVSALRALIALTMSSALAQKPKPDFAGQGRAFSHINGCSGERAPCKSPRLVGLLIVIPVP